MTYFMLSGMVGFATVIFLLWCFRGFRQGRQQAETLGLLVRPVAEQGEVAGRNIRRIVRASFQARRFIRDGDIDRSRVTVITTR